jgi:glycosyltransferase involved in cell wall biosynthesis
VTPDAPCPFVSVIIPVFEDRGGLAVALEALARQTYPASRFEVIVVDNASRAPPAEVVGRFPFAQLGHEPRPGSYSARNRGLTLAQGEIFAFTDADCEPAEDWLERGVARVLEGGRVVVGGLIQARPRKPGRPTPTELYDIIYGYQHRRSIERTRGCYTANVIAPRAAFDEAGPFDSNLLSGGDYDWSRRAAAAGFKVVYCEDVRVATPARSSLFALMRRYARFAGSMRDRRRKRGDRGLPWYPGNSPARAPRFEDVRLAIRAREATVLTKLMLVPVALAIRLTFLLEAVRISLGGKPLR